MLLITTKYFISYFFKNQRIQMVNQQNQMLRAGQQMNSNKPAVPGVTANNGVNSPSNMQRNPPAVNAMNKPAMRQMANSGAASPANRMSTQSPVNTSKGKSGIASN